MSTPIQKSFYRVSCPDFDYEKICYTPQSAVCCIVALAKNTGCALQSTPRHIRERIEGLPDPLPFPETPYMDFFGIGAHSVTVEHLI